MARKFPYWTKERVKRLRKNCHKPWEELLTMFPGKTKDALRYVMSDRNIRRDRDKVPNKTKGPIIWTAEKVAELQEHRNDPWPELKSRFKLSMSRIEHIMSENEIKRDKPTSILWTKEANRILVETAVQSHQYNARTGEGRRKLRQLREKATSQLKKIGFRGHPSKNALGMRIGEITAEHLKQLGFPDLSVPLGWGAPMDSLGRAKEQASEAVKTHDQAEKLIRKQAVEEIAKLEEVTKKALDKIFEALRREFAEEFSKPDFKFTRESFDKITEEVIWTEGPKGVLTALKEAVKNGISPEDFHKLYTRYSLELVQEKTAELTGLTNKLHRISFQPISLRGVGRFASPEELQSGQDFKFPASGFKNPFPVLEGNGGSILLLNGANIGLKFNPLIEDNPVRLALAMGRICQDKAVIITNTIDIYTKKAAGNSRVLRAIFSGMNVNPDLFPESYRQEVLDILKKKPLDAVVYQKPREAFLNVMRGWHKISVIPYKKNKDSAGFPEFPGNIYVVFGLREHQLAATMAYWHIHYLTRVKQNRIKADLKLAWWALTQAESDGAPLDALRDLEEEIEALQDKEERTIISDVIEEWWQKYYYLALGYIAQTFEKMIPNCRVIGMSTTHLKVGAETLTVHIPTNARLTDGSLSEYTHTYGPKVMRKEMARSVVICHPYGLSTRGTAREVDAEGQRDQAAIFSAPICVDEEYLREVLRQLPGREHEIGRKIFNELSAPGVLRFQLVNGRLVIDDIPIAVLKAYNGGGQID